MVWEVFVFLLRASYDQLSISPAGIAEFSEKQLSGVGGWMRPTSPRSLFAYGATGTGKSYSMYGGKTKPSRGVIPRLCRKARPGPVCTGGKCKVRAGQILREGRCLGPDLHWIFSTAQAKLEEGQGAACWVHFIADPCQTNLGPWALFWTFLQNKCLFTDSFSIFVILFCTTYLLQKFISASTDGSQQMEKRGICSRLGRFWNYSNLN